MLGGTRVGRKALGKAAGRAGTKPHGRANGHRRPETMVPLPALPEDDGLDSFADEARRRPFPGCCRCRWWGTAR